MGTLIGRVGAVPALVVLALLAGCTGSGEPGPAGTARPPDGATASARPNAPVLTTPPKVEVSQDLGVPVRGGFGQPPDFRVPSGKPPRRIGLQVLHEGSGAEVTLGSVLVAHYQLRSWATAKEASAVVDDSFARGIPVTAVVGAGQVIKNWDAALAGRRAGSRVLLLLPGNGPASITRPMAAVVDILAVVPVGAAASGSAADGRPGMPEVVSTSSGRPQIRSVKGIDPASAGSQLLVTGGGAAIRPDRLLVVHTLTADGVTGKTRSQTWGERPIVHRAGDLQQLVTALVGAKVGSRAVAVLPAGEGEHPQVLVVDVLAQI